MRSLRNSLVLICAFLVYAIAAAGGQPNSELTYQAIAMWRGHLYVDWAAAGINEKILWGGHWYILHPPLAAFVMALAMPMGLSQITVLTFLAALSAMLVYRLTASMWLTAFYAFGTVVCYEATVGAPWGFVLILSTIPTLMALLADDPTQAGIWAGIAFLARYDLVLAWPLYLLRWRSWKPLIGCIAALGVYVWYNQIRFGTWTDIAMFEWHRVDPQGIALKGGMFGLKYLPMNLYTALFMAPKYDPTYVMCPSMAGQAIVLTSPAFLLALRARLTRATAALWATIILVMGPAMLVYANGHEQFGARYWIQVYPFLLALMAREKLDQLGYVLIAASIVLCTVGATELRLGR